MEKNQPTKTEPRARRPYVRPEVKSEPAKEVYALAFASCGLGNTAQVDAGCCQAGF